MAAHVSRTTLKEFQSRGQSDPEADLVFSWFLIEFKNPQRDTRENCVKEFMEENELQFEPLSFYGFHTKSKCMVLIYYSMRARNTSQANLFMKCRFSKPISQKHIDLNYHPLVLTADPSQSVTSFISNSFDIMSLSGNHAVGNAPKIATLDLESQEARDVLKKFEKDAKDRKFVRYYRQQYFMF